MTRPPLLARWIVGAAAPSMLTQVPVSFRLSMVLPLIVAVLAPAKYTPELLKLRIVLPLKL